MPSYLSNRIIDVLFSRLGAPRIELFLEGIRDRLQATDPEDYRYFSETIYSELRKMYYSEVLMPDGRSLVLCHSIPNRRGDSVRFFFTNDSVEIKNLRAWRSRMFSNSHLKHDAALSNLISVRNDSNANVAMLRLANVARQLVSVNTQGFNDDMMANRLAAAINVVESAAEMLVLLGGVDE